MDAKSRLRAVYTVWTAFVLAVLAVNAGVIIYQQDIGLANIILTIVLAIMSISATGFIFNWGDLPTSDRSSTDRQSEKLKRQSRADALLDMLDDETLEALRRRLQEREGNLPLGALLQDDGELHGDRLR